MNLKSFLLLSSAFMSSDVLAQGQEERKLKNENCSISGDISCTVINDGTDCRDLNIRLDQCKKIKVLMDPNFKGSNKCQPLNFQAYTTPLIF